MEPTRGSGLVSQKVASGGVFLFHVLAPFRVVVSISDVSDWRDVCSDDEMWRQRWRRKRSLCDEYDGKDRNCESVTERGSTESSY